MCCNGSLRNVKSEPKSQNRDTEERGTKQERPTMSTDKGGRGGLLLTEAERGAGESLEGCSCTWGGGWAAPALAREQAEDQREQRL